MYIKSIYSKLIGIKNIQTTHFKNFRNISNKVYMTQIKEIVCINSKTQYYFV